MAFKEGGAASALLSAIVFTLFQGVSTCPGSNAGHLQPVLRLLQDAFDLSYIHCKILSTCPISRHSKAVQAAVCRSHRAVLSILAFCMQTNSARTSWDAVWAAPEEIAREGIMVSPHLLDDHYTATLEVSTSKLP